jgi:hypothetical protein
VGNRFAISTKIAKNELSALGKSFPGLLPYLGTTIWLFPFKPCNKCTIFNESCSQLGERTALFVEFLILHVRLSCLPSISKWHSNEIMLCCFWFQANQFAVITRKAHRKMWLRSHRRKLCLYGLMAFILLIVLIVIIVIILLKTGVI